MTTSGSIPVLSTNTILDQELLSKAARRGIFYFEIPEDCQAYIQPALKLCYQFPTDAEVQKYTDGKFGGYHKREHDQIESFYVERRDWKKVLPEDLLPLANKMQRITQLIIAKILRNAGIPENLWKEGTGYVTEGEGQYHFSCNHYRPEMDAEGIKSHRDFGYVSLLFTEKAGLEALQHGKWKDVAPLKGHFVVVLGKAFEILVNDAHKVSAVWHKVRRLSEERASFAVTCDNQGDLPVKRYATDRRCLETVHPNYQSYLNECFKEVY